MRNISTTVALPSCPLPIHERSSKQARRRFGHNAPNRPALATVVAAVVFLLVQFAFGQNTNPVFTPIDNVIWPGNAAARTNSAPTNTAFLTMETLDDKHHLALGDKLTFRIVEDQEDPNEKMEPKSMQVGDRGDVEVPYIGPFPATGKTCKQLAREIKKELEKDYYRRATVLLSLESLSKTTGKVYVMGEVRLTGPVEIPGDEALTVGKAILRAGGFTTYADKKHVKLTRKGPSVDGEPETLVVNVSEVLEKGKADKDLNLEPGDVIFVPTRLINL